MKNKIVFFDVCGTLVNCNTTFDFIKSYHLKNKNYFKLIFCYILYSNFGKFLNKYFKISLRREFLRTIKNQKKSDLDLFALSYAERILEKKVKVDIFNAFLEYKEDKTISIVLVSASIEPVISAIAKLLNVKYYSSSLRYDNNIFSGDLLFDLKGKKDQILKCYNQDFYSIFYSDNHDDIECAKYVSKYFYIVNGKKYNKSCHVFNNIEFIYD